MYVGSAPTRSVLLDPVLTKLTGFELLYEKQPIGSSGVTALHVYFWNDSQLPILESEVMAPYTVALPPGVRILSARRRRGFVRW